MRKSQIITLIILFVAVSLFIWIGACSDKNDTPNPSSTIKINSPGTGTPTPGQETGAPTPEATPTAEPGVTKPIVDFTQVDNLRTAELELDVSFTAGRRIERYLYVISLALFRSKYKSNKAS